jgi:hypothetical protein
VCGIADGATIGALVQGSDRDRERAKEIKERAHKTKKKNGERSPELSRARKERVTKI